MKPSTLTLLAALLAVLLVSCTNTIDDGLVSIEIYLDPGIRLQPVTITPDIPLDISAYRVYGSGPAASTFEIVTGERSCVAEGLLPGDWTIGAEGLNTVGAVLFSGETACTIDRETRLITVELDEATGDGALQLTFLWEESLVSNPTLTVELSKEGGAVPLSPVMTAGGASVNTTIEAGLYEMRALLSNNGEHLAGAADYVKIIAGYETTGTVALRVSLALVSPEIVLTAPRLVPLQVAIHGYDPPVFTGAQVTLHGRAEAGIEASFQWFVDGVPAGTGDELIPDTTSAGAKRIDLLAWADGFASGGSASVEMAVYESVSYGSLVFVESIFDNDGPADGLLAARALSVTGGYLYTAGYGEDEIGVYRIDETTGKLTFVTIVRAADLPEPGLLSGPSALAHGATGLLAAGCAKSGALILFTVDVETGVLSYLDSAVPAAADFSIPAGGLEEIPGDANPLAAVSGIVFWPAGDIIYAAGPGSDTVTSYKTAGGVITPYQIVAGEVLEAAGFDGALLRGAAEVAISKDGSFLAAACRQAHSLVVFEIDPIEGVLVPVAAFADGVAGVDGLRGAEGVSFSPDGRHIYTTGYYANAVSLVNKDPETAVWSFIATWKKGSFPHAALDYPRGVVVSPDGTEVYVCASRSDALTVFSRDPDTGILSAPESAVNGEDRNVGLDGIRKIAVGGGGEFVYAVSSNDSAAALFRRE